MKHRLCIALIILVGCGSNVAVTQEEPVMESALDRVNDGLRTICPTLDDEAIAEIIAETDELRRQGWTEDGAVQLSNMECQNECATQSCEIGDVGACRSCREAIVRHSFAEN